MANVRQQAADDAAFAREQIDRLRAVVAASSSASTSASASSSVASSTSSVSASASASTSASSTATVAQLRAFVAHAVDQLAAQRAAHAALTLRFGAVVLDNLLEH